MVTWWRRQRAALLALAISLAVCAGVHVWLDVLPTVRDDAVTLVAPGQSGELAGQRLSLTSTVWGEFDAPAGTRSLSVLLRASGGTDAALCGATRLTEPATGRDWLDARSLLGVPRDRGESTCTAESRSYDVLAVFVVPDDAAGPFEFEVSGDGETVRFVLAP